MENRGSKNLLKNEISNMTSPFIKTPPGEHVQLNKLATEIYNSGHKTQNVEFRFNGLNQHENNIDIINQKSNIDFETKSKTKSIESEKSKTKREGNKTKKPLRNPSFN